MVCRRGAKQCGDHASDPGLITRAKAGASPSDWLACRVASQSEALIVSAGLLVAFSCGPRPRHCVGDSAVADVAVLRLVGRADAVQESGQRGRLEGAPSAFGELVDQGAEPVHPKVRCT